MAIRLNAAKSERILFCASKLWGDPDMPPQMQYPVIEVTEEGETYDYPLTFICQINCEDIAPFDTEGLLPHEGMLYFFAAMDKWLGYDSPADLNPGEWPKGAAVVKYAKEINFETFQSSILVDDDDQSLTEPEMELSFEICPDDESCTRLLGQLPDKDTCERYPQHMSLLQLVSDNSIGTDFGEDGFLDIFIKDSDLKFGNWKRSKAFLKQ